jgi:hypothetical protein
MLQAARLTTMDSSSLGLPRQDYGGVDSESGSGGEYDASLVTQHMQTLTLYHQLKVVPANDSNVPRVRTRIIHCASQACSAGLQRHCPTLR